MNPPDDDGYFFKANGAGFPNKAIDSGEPTAFGANEIKHLNSVAEMKNEAPTGQPPGFFLAISGREYTASDHLILVPAQQDDTACAQNLDCFNPSYVYQWANGTLAGRPTGSGWVAAVILAHPGSQQLEPQYDPVNNLTGFSVNTHGIEMGFEWLDREPIFIQAVRKGYHLFPAYGSDRHHHFMNRIVYPGWDNAQQSAFFTDNETNPLSPLSPNPQRGATLCWVPGAPPPTQPGTC